MPLYMDIHENAKGMSLDDVKEAHKKDLAVQGKHGVKFLTYWHNAESGKIFCLSEAPNENAAKAVHKEAHGKEPDAIYEVQEGH